MCDFILVCGLPFYFLNAVFGEGIGNPLQYSCLENSWKEEPGRLQSMALQRVGHDWVTSLSFYSSFWRRKWQPTPVFLPGESHGQRGLVGYSLWGCKESDTTKQLTHTHNGVFRKSFSFAEVQILNLFFMFYCFNFLRKNLLTELVMIFFLSSVKFCSLRVF